jgi:hypothetical protein
MELNSEAKMADGKYRETYVVGSVDRENTVYTLLDRKKQTVFVNCWDFTLLLVVLFCSDIKH